jgi:hypothetical protein
MVEVEAPRNKAEREKAAEQAVAVIDKACGANTHRDVFIRRCALP